MLLENLHLLPGDTRTQIGFITYSSSIHFYNLSSSQPQQLIVTDIDDVFIPTPDGLLVKLRENEDNVRKLLMNLPSMFSEESGSGSCLGAAVLVAQKLLSQLGGRITVFQHSMPSVGPGALNIRDGKNVQQLQKDLSPQADFYKVWFHFLC